jgi:hypothetical protein
MAPTGAFRPRDRSTSNLKPSLPSRHDPRFSDLLEAFGITPDKRRWHDHDGSVEPAAELLNGFLFLVALYALSVFLPFLIQSGAPSAMSRPRRSIFIRSATRYFAAGLGSPGTRSTAVDVLRSGVGMQQQDHWHFDYLARHIAPGIGVRAERA